MKKTNKKPGVFSLLFTAVVGLVVFAAVVTAAKMLPVDPAETVGSGNVPERPAAKPAEYSQPAPADRSR